MTKNNQLATVANTITKITPKTIIYTGSPEHLALMQQKETLTAQIENLNSFLDGDNGTGVLENLFKAIKTNRWYQFKDKDKIYWDKNTGYIWLNPLKYKIEFRWWEEAKDHAAKLDLYGFKNWQLPSLEIFMENFDNKAPYLLGDSYYWLSREPEGFTSFVFHNGTVYEYRGTDNQPFICCNNIFVNQAVNFKRTKFVEHSIKNGKAHYYQPEINLIDFFIKYDLTPLFNNNLLDEIWDCYYKRLELLKLLENIENQIIIQAPSTQSEPMKQIGISFDTLIASYNLEKSKISLPAYYNDLIRWQDGLLAYLEQFEKDEALILGKAEQLNRTIADFKTDDNILAERKEYLVKYLDFGLNPLYQKLLSFKEEAVKSQKELKNSDDLTKLAELENRPRPSFYNIAEHSVNLVKARLEKIAWFRDNEKTLFAISKLHNDWAKEYKDFSIISNKEFLEQCKGECINKGVTSIWWQNYHSRRTQIEASLLSLLKFGLENSIELEIVLSAAQKIKSCICDLVNKFYFKELIPIYQKLKLSGNPEAAFLEKIITQTKISEINFAFEEKLQDEIFRIADRQNRFILCRWAQSWFDITLSELTDNSDLNKKITTESLSRFRELKKANTEFFLQDAYSYAESRKKTAAEYISIMYMLKNNLMPEELS